MNVIVYNPSSDGHLIVYAAGEPLPLVSTINFTALVPARANGAVVPLAAAASYQVSVFAGLAGTGHTVNVVLDITGYFR